MLQSEAINKLSKECCLAIGDFDHYQTIRTYIQMALVVGVEHYTKDMEEVVSFYRDGVEAGRFKSIGDASIKLGIPQSSISDVLRGVQHTAGGLKFMKITDYELVKRKEDECIPFKTIHPLTGIKSKI
jgi:hypothetical protein